MKVLVNNSLYEMGNKEYMGVIKVASAQIPCGIYAVEKVEFANCEKINLKEKRT